MLPLGDGRPNPPLAALMMLVVCGCHYEFIEEILQAEPAFRLDVKSIYPPPQVPSTRTLVVGSSREMPHPSIQLSTA